jgi:transposase
MAKSIMACAGIDTGKRKLDIALAQGAEQLRIDNDAAGHVSLTGWLRRHRVKRIGIEASGGYEAAVVAELRRAGFVVILFQPAQVRAYAKFVLQRAKNDRIDAGLIARCTAAAERVHAPPIRRASAADRPARRGHRLPKDPSRELSRCAHSAALGRGDRASQGPVAARVARLGAGDP